MNIKWPFIMVLLTAAMALALSSCRHPATPETSTLASPRSAVVMSHSSNPLGGDANVTLPANRLIREKSPYLLQHAYNPVDWHAWGDEAFERARREDKPIFLSIGYSTCHWCHVMEHESFEDAQVAALMNRAFINIKVDREERPDIDGVYMTVCQMMTGSGGWPLTIIMAPDKRPFFAATYIPKHARYGHPGMMDLVPMIEKAWKDQREDILKSADGITQALARIEAGELGDDLNRGVIDKAYQTFTQRFDDRHGGFGTAPKFPTPHNLTFLLRQWKRTGDPQARAMVEQTLQAMRRGGVYDHIGFGFHRYSTDAHWLLPHFEKMLYDQAGLAIAYTEAWQATGNDEYGQTAEEIIAYVLRDMTSPEGGFYSAEDADSEGEEGKFYVWTTDEIREILGPEDALLFTAVYNAEQAGNFSDESTGHMTGANILHLEQSWDDIAAVHSMPVQTLRRRIEAARQKLFDAREKRIHPHKDDKILTDWNGMMIAALALAARAFDRPDYADAAAAAADFIDEHLRGDDGRLLHRWRDGDAAIPAFMDDYAWYINGLIELYQTTFNAVYLERADALMQEAIGRYWDDASGGFFLTADDAEELLVRKKEIYDGAHPSGNSVMFENLLKLGRLLAKPGYEDRADKLMRAFSDQIGRLPMAHTNFLGALDFALGPSHEVVIAGPRGGSDTRAMLREINRRFLPAKVVMLRPGTDGGAPILKVAPYLTDYAMIDGKATAYVCQNYRCHSPTTSISQMLELLSPTITTKNEDEL